MTRASTADATVSFALAVPASIRLSELAAGAIATLDARDRVQTDSALFSGGDVHVGHDASVEDVLATEDVQLLDRAHAAGVVQAGGQIQKGSQVVTGSEVPGVPFEPKVFSWTAEVPMTSSGSVILEPEQSVRLEPGRYDHLSVKRDAKVFFESGVYSFNEVQVESGGQLVVDSSDGPTQLLAQTRFVFRGSVNSATVGRPQLLVGVVGTEAVMVEASFTGVVLAPNADVRLQAARPDGHTGFFWGKNVTLEPDTIIHPYAFDWVGVVGGDAYEGPPEDVLQFDLDDPTVDVFLSEADDEEDSVLETSKAFDETIEFSLPPSYPLSGGVIGDGTVTLSFGVSGGTEVTCQYQGGSASSQPQTELELNKGRTLHFVECSDGLPPDARREADYVNLAVQLPEDLPDGLPGVTVAPPMIEDGSCSDVMQMLSPAETQQMRETFDWSAAQEVAETDTLGRPTLYYAWIYVRDEEEFASLNKLLIHRLNGPFFQEEYEELNGRCGMIENPGDGLGVFVPAFIPGVTYNRLIDALTSPDVEGDGVIFDAVILREVPASVRTPQGSIALEPLAESGFRYLSYLADPLGQAATLEQDMGFAKLLVDAIGWVGQAVRDVGQWFVGALGDIDKVLRGRRHMVVNLRATTGDPAFAPGQPMIRAWGPYAGLPLAATGMEVRIAQWLFDAPIPTHSQGLTNINGRAEMDVVEGNFRGSGICIELSTSGAMVTDFLLPNTLCDLRRWDPVAGSPADVKNQQFRNTNHVELLLVEPRISGLFQADDVYRWSSLVLGFQPKQARIMSGFWADTLAPNTNSTPPRKRLFAPCLNYPNTLSDAATFAAAWLGGFAPGGIYTAFYAAVVTATVMNTDIVMALNSRLPVSREVMSHEYGHYLFCSLLQKHHGDAVSYLVHDTIQKDPQKLMGDVRYINEAVADFFTGQVVGAADYSWIQTGDAVNNTYCSASLPIPGSRHGCWEDNQRGVATTLQDSKSIGRIATLLHDVFDGQGQPRFASTFGDGDVWTGSAWTGTAPALGLSVSSTGYLNTDTGLDTVALPVAGLDAFAREMAQGVDAFGGGVEFSEEKLHRALNTAMIESGLNWCDRCRVLALHQPSLGAEDAKNLIETCATDPFLSPIMGPSPYSWNEMDAFSCQHCPQGTTLGSDGLCSGAACSVDVVVDASAPDRLPDYSFAPDTVVSGDTCPSTFIVRVENLSAGGDDVAARLKPVPETEESCNQLFSFESRVEDGGGGSISVHSSVGVYSGCPPMGDICVAGCLPSSLPTDLVEADDAEAVEFQMDPASGQAFTLVFDAVK